MESQFEYYAFISYKREDEKWAKWLQKKLENYKLPTVIRKEIPRLPKRIRPVFRDKTDLGAGLLTESLRSELSRSQYLIVICSPQAAQSEWVGNEINAFIEMGRTDHIIPFIVYGEPNSKDAVLECFHPIIKEKMPEPLGINIQEIGKEQAFIKVVAKILGLRFDSVWNRHRRSLIRRRIVMVCVAFLILCGLGFVWDYNRIKYEYYADYVDKGGIAQGVIKLNKSQVKERATHYRFEKKEYKVQKIIFANSAGIPTDHIDSELIERVPIQIYKYKENGGLDQIELQDFRGNPIVTQCMGGNNNDRIELKSKTTGTAQSVISSYTSINNTIVNKAEIRSYKLTRNQKGYVIRKEFKKYIGQDDPACDAEGIYGIDYTLDSIGRIITMNFLGIDNQPNCNKKGIAGKHYSYDKFGNISKCIYFDLNGNLILNEELWAIRSIYANEKTGNIEKVEYLDDYNKLCINSMGFACKIAKYENGNTIVLSYLGIDGKLCTIDGGFSKWMSKYDDLGNQIECSYWGVDNKPRITAKNIFKFTAKYDGTNQIEIQYFGIDGKPCNSIYNYSKWVAKYDKYDNQVEIAFYDKNNKLQQNKNKVAKITAKYQNKKIIEQNVTTQVSFSNKKSINKIFRSFKY